jgi:hypothetical protein
MTLHEHVATKTETMLVKWVGSLKLLQSRVVNLFEQ